MCRICGKYKCPPSCPEYAGESAERGKRVGVCQECGEGLCEYDEFVYSYGKPYCMACYKEREEEGREDMTEATRIDERARLRAAEEYLRGYQLNRKLLRLDRYEKEYFHTDESDIEAFGEAPLARARMFEIRHFVMGMENGDCKLLLYYHYIKGEPVERCAELLGISRSTAFRMKARALRLAADRLERQRGTETHN